MQKEWGYRSIIGIPVVQKMEQSTLRDFPRQVNGPVTCNRDMHNSTLSTHMDNTDVAHFLKAMAILSSSKKAAQSFIGTSGVCVCLILVCCRCPKRHVVFCNWCLGTIFALCFSLDVSLAIEILERFLHSAFVLIVWSCQQLLWLESCSWQPFWGWEKTQLWEQWFSELTSHSHLPGHTPSPHYTAHNPMGTNCVLPCTSWAAVFSNNVLWF